MLHVNFTNFTNIRNIDTKHEEVEYLNFNIKNTKEINLQKVKK